MATPIPLGNALRRILLSSMPGFAPTEVSIAGVLHEYSALDGVREDVVDILPEPEGRGAQTSWSRRCAAHPQKEVKACAGDIELPHDVEVVNPDHPICHPPPARSKWRSKVEKGRGYQPVSVRVSQDDNRTIGNILLDASFSPVHRVSFTVENARVEQRTDLDRLVMDIETNGVIEPEEAVRAAAS